MKGLRIGHQSGASPYQSCLSTSQECAYNASQQAMKTYFKKKIQKKFKIVIRKKLSES